ncbi:hypothetical protein [Nocardiopsis lambiniae]|uniref:Uncharacterized protein n=1 Tax=Nocardiopsis lambiniae TaxID=3075539 RepID=A0ABU2MBM6_9ACTN|nr:hypothetical protein [Nocardiopsis sp. DSM 44743]MDT0329980.1 hypothetical protein [Nocardiopsis sp. DSM 44743]
MPGTPPPADPRSSSLLAVLGALLDRSLVQIEDATADARLLDRETARTAADVWADNTHPLFLSALARGRRRREARARDALLWMADRGPRRRAWMVERAAEAGHDIDGLLPPAPEPVPHRDHAGNLRPVVVPVTEEVAADLAADYDLDTATIRALAVERRGTGLAAQVTIAAERLHRVAGPTGPAELDVRLPEVDEVRFDTRDAPGVRLTCGPTGVTVAFGDGLLRGGKATLWNRDDHWHLSARGRRAERDVPPTLRRRWDRGHGAAPLEGVVHGPAARTVSHLLTWIMTRIRSTCRRPEGDRVPTPALCRALAGAGTAIVAAGAHLSRRRRERAFRELALEWVRRGGPETAPWFAAALDRVSRRSGTEELPEARRLAGELAAQAAPRAEETTDTPSSAVLRMVSYTASHQGAETSRSAEVTLHLAVPADAADPGAPWMLRVLTGGGPGRVRVLTRAFRGTLRPRTIDDDGGVSTLLAGDGALEARARWS